MTYRNWLLMSVFLFGIGLVLGLTGPSGTTELLAEDIAAMEELAGLVASLPQSSVLVLILVKNISAILISFVLSPLLLLAPLMALIVNGWLLGLVATAVLEEKSLGYLLTGLLPHGIFEIPALIMAEAVALSVGSAWLLAIFTKRGRARLVPNLKRNLKYLAIALALFLPAAVLETYVTPLLLR